MFYLPYYFLCLGDSGNVCQDWPSISLGLQVTMINRTLLLTHFGYVGVKKIFFSDNTLRFHGCLLL